MTIDDVWSSYRRWARVSRRLDSWLARVRGAHLALLLLGSLAGALAAQHDWFARPATVALGGVGGAALAAAALIQTQLLTRATIADRLTARTTAESLKSLAYLYLATAPPFAGENRDAVLRRRYAAQEKKVEKDLTLVAGVRPDDRRLPRVGTADAYLSDRAKEQRRWHEHAAAQHQALARRWRFASVVATGLAAVATGVGEAFRGPDLAALVAVLATAAAAFTAHLASEQHDRVSVVYATTAGRLGALIRDFEASARGTDTTHAFVRDVERLLAEQNHAWSELFDP